MLKSWCATRRHTKLLEDKDDGSPPRPSNTPSFTLWRVLVEWLASGIMPRTSYWTRQKMCAVGMRVEKLYQRDPANNDRLIVVYPVKMHKIQECEKRTEQISKRSEERRVGKECRN